MSMPPTHDLRDLGHDAQRMAKDCKNERLAMTLQTVAVGSMLIMSVAAAVHLIKELFRKREPHGMPK